MRRLLPLMVLLAAALACSFSDLPGTIQPGSLPAPSETPRLILPTPTAEPSPTPTPEAPLLAPALTGVSLPQITELHMFSEQKGWAVTPGGVVRTSDGGKSWQPLSIPLVSADAGISAAFLSAETVYILSRQPDGSGLLSISRDAGQTWQQRPAPFSDGRMTVVDETVYVLQSLGAGAGSQPVAVQVIYNGGESFFQPFTHTPGEPEVEGSLPMSGDKTGISFITPERGWISGSRPVDNEIYLFRSDDSGVSWKPQAILPPPDLGGFMAVSQPPLFFRGDPLNGVLPVDFYPSASGEVQRAFYFTSDAGETWTPAAPLFPAVSAFDFINAQTGWVISANQLIFTADSGATWSRLPVAFSPAESVIALDFVSAQTGWLVTQTENFVTNLYQTNDGGYSWAAFQ
ncbi:MAG: hypothetical protein OHK0031_16610 [Anaerolineales bacterium]